MVTLVVTIGSGSLNFYSQKLAQKLNTPKVYTDIYQRIAERFNQPASGTIRKLSQDTLYHNCARSYQVL